MRTAFLVLLAASCIGPSSTTPLEAANAIEKWTGADLCNGIFGSERDHMVGSDLIVGNARVGCGHWGVPKSRVKAMSGATTTDYGPLPIVVYYNPQQEAESSTRLKRISIYLIGGPGQSIAPNPHDDAFTQHLDPNEILIKFPYSGTTHTSVYPNADLPRAINQISDYLLMLRRRNPDVQMVLIGESLGGVIAVSALSGSANKARLDKVILVNPMIYSPAEAYRNFLGNIYGPEMGVGVKTIHVANKDGVNKWRSVPADKLFQSFFGRSEQNVDLANRLGTVGNIPILLIYGAEDKIIGKENIVRSRFPTFVRFKSIEGLSQERGATYDDLIGQAIVNFLN